VDQRYKPEDCVQAGFTESFVRAVIDKVRHTHFKRVMPPIAKWNNSIVNYDSLTLRDWGT
jgi:NAD+ synthase